MQHGAVFLRNSAPCCISEFLDHGGSEKSASRPRSRWTAEYDFQLDPLPVIAEVEACAEKLARYRRSPPLAPDLYDLAWFSSRPINEALLRRLWVLKVYSDVVEDGRGTKALQASDVLAERDLKDLLTAEIGVLTQPKDIPGWEAKVRARFAFLSHMDELEMRIASCNARHLQEVQALLGSEGF
jgi:predicted nucleotidyltransferase component of viral defense system